MSRLRSWLAGLSGASYIPLFALTEAHVVQTRTRGTDKRLLCRSPEMEAAVIDHVTRGLAQPSWRGLLYLMVWGPHDRLRPLYIGKAGRDGRKEGKISANLEDIATNKSKFARWGDGNAYHIGDLSQALFGWSAYKDAGQKYERWAQMLFVEK